MSILSDDHRLHSAEVDDDVPVCGDARPSETDIAVNNYCDWLSRVAEGEDAAYNLSHVLDGIGRKAALVGKKSERPVISSGQRSRLIEATRTAREANPSMFWNGSQATREITAQGFKALKTIIVLWGECEDERARRPEHFVRNALDQARIFQNLLHNACLAEDIAERARERIAKEIDQMRIAALGGAE